MTVAEVPITPIRPLRVAVTAAMAVGTTTPVKGTGSSSFRPTATELTVPQAAIIILTPRDSRKYAS